MTSQTKQIKSIFEPIKASPLKRAAAFLIDIILFLTTISGMALLVSYIVGYQSNYDLLEEAYIKHGVYISGTEGYEFCDTTKEECLKAWELFNQDPEACFYFDHAIELTLIIITISVVVSLLIYEFIIPLISKKGQTIGMKIMKIGLVDKEGVKAKHVQLFIRFLFGKALICTLLPIYGFLFMVYNIGSGMFGFILFVSIPLIDILMTLFSKNKTGIANAIGNVYAYEVDQTYIFENKEELIKAKLEEDRKKEKQKSIY